MFQKPPEQDPTSIGKILVEMDLIDEEELEKFVVEFRDTEDTLLGQFLVKKTSITEEQVELAFLKQQQLRGKVTKKMLCRVLEIADNRHNRLMNSADQLIALSQQAVKANGRG